MTFFSPDSQSAPLPRLRQKTLRPFPSPSRHLLFLSHCPLFIRHCHPSPVIASEQRERGNPYAPFPSLSSQRTNRCPWRGHRCPWRGHPRSPHKCASLAVTKDNPLSQVTKDKPLPVALPLPRALALALPPTRTCGHRHTLPRTAAPGLSISDIRLTI